MSNEQRNPHRQWANNVLRQATTNLAGLDDVIRLSLVAYCTGSHVLLEGNPGLGKTTLVKQLARAIGLQEGRIQFTPDLMPTDITGTMLPNYAAGNAREWAFVPGPIFSSLLLADEINRATPKTQSALLEAMAEGQVTVLGQTYRLPQPFVVMATQNPLDHTGTYSLPEAQADRFMFKILMPVPSREAVGDILDIPANRQIVRTHDQRAAASPREALYAAFNPSPGRSVQQDTAFLQQLGTISSTFTQHAQVIEQLPLQPAVQQHLLNLFQATNGRFGERDLIGLSGEQRSRLKLLVEKLFTYGLGPRAVLNLAKAARAWALLFGTSTAPVESLRADGVDLAHVLMPILRHRLKLAFDWERLYDNLGSGAGRAPFAKQSDLMAVLIADLALATAPSDQRAFGEYQPLLRKALESQLSRPEGR